MMKVGYRFMGIRMPEYIEDDYNDTYYFWKEVSYFSGAGVACSTSNWQGGKRCHIQEKQ